MTGPVRVLLVDDHPVVRAGLSGMLALASDIVVVGQASNGAEGLQLATELHPDVVLMDLRMPVMDGVRATASLRAMEPAPYILVLTTYDTDGDIVRAVEAGASGYLLKDAPAEVLAAAIHEVARGGSPLSSGVAARLMVHARAPAEKLTTRELAVLQCVARGASNREIARDLQISEATVKTHLVHVFSKLEVGDRTGAVMRAIERGLLTLE
jgi:DNA-binding NarL/FixJ family response regulator